MASSERVFLGCWVSLDEQDRLCEVSLDRSTIEEVASPSEQQIDTIFQAFRHHRVEIRHEGDAPSNPLIILDDIPSVTMTPDVNTPPQTRERPEKHPRPASYTGLAARSSAQRTGQGCEGACRRRRKEGAGRNQDICASVPSRPCQATFLAPYQGNCVMVQKSAALQGPDPKLWLDFSKITGKLSCMKTAAMGTEANVALTWKRYNGQDVLAD